jgi:chemotaxis protein methyltransferase CheR
MIAPLAVEHAVEDAEFAFFRDLVHTRSGIALKESKRSLVAARLGRRLRALGLSSFAEYRRFLEISDPSGSELALMINCMTTNKTSFFREGKHFAILKDSILAAARAGQKTYRIWSAACSTGEEPYSIAMTALGVAGAVEVCILASDLDTEVLASAEQAVYPMESLEEMDDQARRRYFLRGRDEREGWVLVKPAVRQLVTFRHINLIEEPWPLQTRFDAIFCRNVIIYFDRQTQARLFGRLAQYLATGGLLFVGHAETLFWLDELFVPIDHSVYRARRSAPAAKRHENQSSDYR